MPLPPDHPLQQELADALPRLTPAQIEFITDVIKNFFPMDDGAEQTEAPRESPHLIFSHLIRTYALLNQQQQAFLQALQTLQASNAGQEFCHSWIKKAWDDTGCEAIYNIKDLSFTAVFIPAMFEYLATNQSPVVAQFNEKLKKYAVSVENQVRIDHYLYFYLAETIAQGIEKTNTGKPLDFQADIFQHLLSLIPFASITALMHFTKLFYNLLEHERDADQRTRLVQHIFSLCHRHRVSEIFQEGGQLFQLQLLVFYIILIYEDLNCSFDSDHTELLRKIAANVFGAFKAKRSSLPEQIAILLQQIEKQTLSQAVDAIVSREQNLTL